jgi:hypothetical protein
VRHGAVLSFLEGSFGQELGHLLCRTRFSEIFSRILIPVITQCSASMGAYE